MMILCVSRGEKKIFPCGKGQGERDARMRRREGVVEEHRREQRCGSGRHEPDGLTLGAAGESGEAATARHGRLWEKKLQSISLLCIYALLSGGCSGAQLTAVEQKIIQQEHCRNGTLSLSPVCNSTVKVYRCHTIPQFNVTCLTPVRCGELSMPSNSIMCEKSDSAAACRAVNNPMALQTVEILCKEGYEYVDSSGIGKGFKAEVTCLEDGNYSSLAPAGFSCQPVSCGIYCRYCPDDEEVSADDDTDWKYKDRFGSCCKSYPGSEIVLRQRLLQKDGRFDDLKVDLAPDPAGLYPCDDPTKKCGADQNLINEIVYPNKLHLVCKNQSGSDPLHQIPGSGVANPQCLPNAKCRSAFVQGKWTLPECEVVRGVFVRGMTCGEQAKPPALTFHHKTNSQVTEMGDCSCTEQETTNYFKPSLDQQCLRTACGSTSSGLSCTALSLECEFPKSVNLHMTTEEVQPGAKIYWTWRDESPVTPATGLTESSAALGANLWSGFDIVLTSQVQGCNVVNEFKRLTAVVVVPGKANSVASQTAMIKVTATRGTMPDGLSRWIDENGNNQSGCRMSEGQPLQVVKKRNYQNDLVPKLPLEHSGCAAYRYFVFEPTALAGEEADAYALSELRFYYRKRLLTPRSVSSFGSHPAAEASIYLADGSLDTKLLQLDTCSIRYDFGLPLAVDAYELGTSNDCSIRDPVRWRILASNDGKEWLQIVDQTRISYSMPMQRSHKTGLIPIVLLQPLALTAELDTVTLISSTNVNGALNTITLTFSIRKMADNAKTIVPLGTLIHLGGFPGLSTPESQSFGVHSANLCALPGASDCDTGERRPVVFPTTGNEWKHHSTGLSSLSFTIQRCLTSASLDHITVSFQIINPAVEPQDVTLEMRGEGSAEIQKWEKTEVTELKSSAQPAIEGAWARDTTREIGRNNSISVLVRFTFPPMNGTTLRFEGLKGSPTPSSEELPVHLVFEDGAAVQTSGEWAATPGRLTVRMREDARFTSSDDGTMSWGRNLTVRFALVNPHKLSAAQKVTVSALSVCQRPAFIGGCKGDSGQLQRFTAEGRVLASAEPCSGVFDNCTQCDGQDLICLGCDGKPNGRFRPQALHAEFDQCGVCGGKDACVGCDKVVNSGKKIDACGVCGGANACEIKTKDLNVTWPNVEATLMMRDAPNTASMKRVDSLRFKLRQALAAAYNVPMVSVDILDYQDGRRRSTIDAMYDTVTATRNQNQNVGERETSVAQAQAQPRTHASLSLSEIWRRGWALVARNAQTDAQHQSVGARAAGGVCDARKACWSGCKVNSAPLDGVPLRQDELDACVLAPHLLSFTPDSREAPPHEETFKGPKRRQTRVPAPAAPDVAYTNKLSLVIRINFLSRAGVEYLEQHLEPAVKNGTLSAALVRFGFCRAAKPCDVTLGSSTFNFFYDSPPPPPPPPPKDNELMIIMIALGSVFGVLLCMGLALAYRWRKAIQLRHDVTYKMEDLVEAEERGRKENLRRAHPSSFKPPDKWETNTVVSGSRRSGKSMSRAGGTSVGGSSRGSLLPTKVFDDTGSVVSGQNKGRDARSERSSATGVSGGSSKRGKVKMQHLDRAAIYRQAFPDKFAEVPEETVFEADDIERSSRASSAASSDHAEDDAAGSHRTPARSVATTRSSRSDRYGDRTMAGPAGRGPAPVHGAGQARMLYNHPEAIRETLLLDAGDIDAQAMHRLSQDDASSVASGRSASAASQDGGMYMGGAFRPVAVRPNGSKVEPPQASHTLEQEEVEVAI